MSELHFNQPQGGVLFVGAHPDDETVMAGGILALLHERNIPTHLICVTDGRGGESGGVPEADTPDARAAVRKAELLCAAEALGLTSVTLLDYIDPIMGPDDELFGFDANEAILAQQIVDVIRHRGVSVVLSHGTDGEYGHPAHKQVNRIVTHVVHALTPDVLHYTVMASIPSVEDRLLNASDPAHLALDIMPWIEQKHAAYLCHRTQHALFKRRRKLTDVRDAVRLHESVRRQWPETPGHPDDWFARALIDGGAVRIDQPEQHTEQTSES